MNRLFFVLLFSFFVLNSEAQGNLQFNQVLTYTETISASAMVGASSTYTVPAGKVWKIEYKSTTPQALSTPTGASRLYFYINSASISDNVIKSCPIWLKSGDAIYFQLNQDNPYPYWGPAQTYFISIVEFNIVP